MSCTKHICSMKTRKVTELHLKPATHLISQSFD